MPWYIGLLLNLVVRIGLPAVEKFVSPQVRAIIEQILSIINSSPTPAQTTQQLAVHLNTFVDKSVKS